MRQLRDVEITINALGLELVKCEIRLIEDVDTIMNGLKGRAEALYVIRTYLKIAEGCRSAISVE